MYIACTSQDVHKHARAANDKLMHDLTRILRFMQSPKGPLNSSLHHLQKCARTSIVLGTLKVIDEQSAAASTFWILMGEHECLL
jgi:hypothetical protein